MNKLPKAAIEAMARKRKGAAGFADRAMLYGEPTARGAAAIGRLAKEKPAADETAGAGVAGDEDQARLRNSRIL